MRSRERKDRSPDRDPDHSSSAGIESTTDAAANAHPTAAASESDMPKADLDFACSASKGTAFAPPTFTSRCVAWIRTDSCCDFINV